jgi:hypothetical protein
VVRNWKSSRVLCCSLRVSWTPVRTVAARPISARAALASSSGEVPGAAARSIWS